MGCFWSRIDLVRTTYPLLRTGFKLTVWNVTPWVFNCFLKLYLVFIMTIQVRYMKPFSYKLHNYYFFVVCLERLLGYNLTGWNVTRFLLFFNTMFLFIVFIVEIKIKYMQPFLSYIAFFFFFAFCNRSVTVWHGLFW